jgi:hypothetical protein
LRGIASDCCRKEKGQLKEKGKEKHRKSIWYKRSGYLNDAWFFFNGPAKKNENVPTESIRQTSCPFP